ncbi:MAG TPA: hypothetical protein O0X39_07095 [Methanocorpusculum sp.]|nr:hypothetical protein [Methanocorpusculum sp.]
MKSHLLQGIIILLAAVFLISGTAAAAELTVKAPSAPNGAGDVITVPVILKNDIDFAGFAASVGNNIDGVIITINENRPIQDAGYTVNSKEENKVQKLNALLPYGTSGITDPEIELFDIDIRIVDPNVKAIPLELTLRTLLTASGDEIPLDTVQKVDISNLQLTESVSASVNTRAEETTVAETLPTAVPVAVDMPQEAEPKTNTQSNTQESAGTVDQSPVTSESNPASAQTAVQTAQKTQAAKPAKTQAKSPGFGILAVLAGLAGAAAVIRKE